MQTHETLLKHLMSDLTTLMTDMQSANTFKCFNIDAHRFILRHSRMPVSASYPEKQKKKEKFFDFDVTVVAHADLSSLVYILTYTAGGQQHIHFFRTLEHLQRHLFSRCSIDGVRFSPVDYQPTKDVASINFANHFAWRKKVTPSDGVR
jgi:hypothetical protein